MRVCVVGGAGHVGLVTGASLAGSGHEVVCLDADRERVILLNGGSTPFYEPGLDGLLREARADGNIAFTDDLPAALAGAGMVFLCVGTPAGPDEVPDLDDLWNVVHGLRRHLQGYATIVVKSTVPVGTCDRIRRILADGLVEGRDFDVLICPEFLREGNAIEDASRPDRVVIGAYREEAAGRLMELYSGCGAPLIVTTPRDAELIKYAANAFLATKLSYVNQLSDVCEAVGADIIQVARGMAADRRIGPAFTEAGLGYGGPCLAKDTAALIHAAAGAGCDVGLLRAVQRVNEGRIGVAIRKMERLVGCLAGAAVGVLGLSFKPGTSDVRGSQAVPLIEALAVQGASVRAYDPRAMEEARRLGGPLGVPAELAGSVEEAARDADGLVIATAWPEFREAAWPAVRGLMRRPNLLDCRNLLDPARMRRLGFNYAGMGRRVR